MTHEIRLLDVVALTIDKPEHKLTRGEIGAVVECYPDDAYEVEFVAQDGYTYALATFRGDELLPLREKHEVSDRVTTSAGS
jgi:hypothetical protein